MSHAFPTQPQKHPYYIVAPGYTRMSAGIRVLHLLCHSLRKLGYEAYMVSETVNVYFDAPKLTQDAAQSHFQSALTPIVVYPETIWGNPLQAPFVVRYLLNFPGLLGGPKEFGQEDYLLSYCKGMNPNAEAEKVLFCPASDTSIYFPPPPGTKREGSCFYAGKYTHFHGGKLLPITEGSYEITRFDDKAQTPQEIADLFRRSEVFYCYENSSLSLEAALCGCPVVLLPNPHFTKMIARAELSNDGIAWGNTPSEVERAKATVFRVWENHRRIQDQFWESLKSFAEGAQERVRSIRYTTPITVFDPYQPVAKTWKEKFMRYFNLIWSGVKKPPNRQSFSSLHEYYKKDGYKGIKRKLKEREIRLGKRFV